MNNNDLLETNKINLSPNNKSIPNELLLEPKTSIDTRTTTLYINSKYRNKDTGQLNIKTNNAQLLCIEEYFFIILQIPNSEYINTTLLINFTQISDEITDYLSINETDMLFNEYTKNPIFNVIDRFLISPNSEITNTIKHNLLNLDSFKSEKAFNVLRIANSFGPVTNTNYFLKGFRFNIVSKQKLDDPNNYSVSLNREFNNVVSLKLINADIIPTNSNFHNKNSDAKSDVITITFNPDETHIRKITNIRSILNEYIPCNQKYILNVPPIDNKEYPMDINYEAELTALYYRINDFDFIQKYYNKIQLSPIHRIVNQFKLIDVFNGYTYFFEDTKPIILFNFQKNFKLHLSIIDGNTSLSNEPKYIEKILEGAVLPLKVAFVSLEYKLTYNYYITKINKIFSRSNESNIRENKLKTKYIIDLLPINGDFDEFYNKTPFNICVKNGGECIMYIYNNFTQKKLDFICRNSNTLYKLITKNYIITTPSLMPKNNTINYNNYHNYNNRKCNINILLIARIVSKYLGSNYIGFIEIFLRNLKDFSGNPNIYILKNTISNYSTSTIFIKYKSYMKLYACYSDIILDNQQNIIKIKLQLFISQCPNYITELLHKRNIIYFSINNTKYNLIITNYVTNSKWIVFSFVPINNDIIISGNIQLYFTNGITNNINRILFKSHKNRDSILKKTISRGIIRMIQYNNQTLTNSYIECSLGEGQYIGEILKFNVNYVNLLTSKDFAYKTNFNTEKILLTSYHIIHKTQIKPYIGLFINPKYYNNYDERTTTTSYIKTIKLDKHKFIIEPSYNYAKHIINKKHNKKYIDCLDIMSCEINDIKGMICDETKIFKPLFIKLYEEYITYYFYNPSFNNRLDTAKRIVCTQYNTLDQCKNITIPNIVHNEIELKSYLEEQFNTYSHKLLVKYNNNAKTLSLEFMKSIYKCEYLNIYYIKYKKWVYFDLDNCNLGPNNIIYINAKVNNTHLSKSIINKPLKIFMPNNYIINICLVNPIDLLNVKKNIEYFKESSNKLENLKYIFNSHNINNFNEFNIGDIITKNNTIGYITYSSFNSISKTYKIHYDLLQGVNFNVCDEVSIKNFSGLIVPHSFMYSPTSIIDILYNNLMYVSNYINVRHYTSKGFYAKINEEHSDINIPLCNQLYDVNIYKPESIDYSYNNSLAKFGISNKIKHTSVINNTAHVTKYKILKSYFTNNHNLNVYIRSYSRPIINNNVLINNHNYPLSCYSSTRFIKLTNIYPFYKYIEHFHIIYNILLNTDTGNLFKDNIKKINWNTSYITKTEQDKEGNNAEVLFYTNDLGEIKKIHLLSTGSGYYDERLRTINSNNFDKQVKIKVSIKKGHIDKIVSVVQVGLGYGLNTIPFYNKFIGINLHNNIFDYNTIHRCYYTIGSSNKNNYFNISITNKYITELILYKKGIKQDIISLLVSKIESGSINNITPRIVIKKISNIVKSEPIIFEFKKIVENNKQHNVLIQVDNDKKIIFEKNIEYEIIINIPRIYICFDKYNKKDEYLVPYNYKPLSIFNRILSKYILLDYSSQYYTKRIIKIKILSKQVPTDDKFYKIFIYNSNQADILIGCINKVISLGVDKYILLINLDISITKSQEIDIIYELLNKDDIKVVYNYYNGLGIGGIIERCVFKDTNNIKFFESGDFDLCYNDYLKNKTVIDYSDYESYKLVPNRDILFTKQIGIEETQIKILDSDIFPLLNLKEWDNFHRNKAILKKSYITQLHIKPGFFFKYNEPSIKILDKTIEEDGARSLIIDNILEKFILLDETTQEYKSAIICKSNTIEESIINLCQETLVVFGSTKSNSQELGYIENIYSVDSYNEICLPSYYKTSVEFQNKYDFKTRIIIFNNKLVNVDNNVKHNYIKFLYPITKIHDDIEHNKEYSIIPICLRNRHHEQLYKIGDIICLDFGNKRPLLLSNFTSPMYNIYPSHKTKSSMLFRQIRQVNLISIQENNIIMKLYVDKLPIIYPIDTSILLIKDFYLTTSINYNPISSLPFVYNNEWYTKILYKNLFINKDSFFIDNKEYRSYKKKYPRHEMSESIRIKNVKGIKIPFMNIYKNYNNEFEYLHPQIQTIKPISDGIYSNYTNIIGDFQIKPNNIYENPKEDIGEIYDWVIIKGIHLGYGGDIQSIYNDSLRFPDTCEYIVNNIETLPNNIYRLQLSSNLENPQLYVNDMDNMEFGGIGGDLITETDTNPYNLSNKDNVLLCINKFNYIEHLGDKQTCFSILTPKNNKATDFIGGGINEHLDEIKSLSELDIQLKTLNGDIYNTRNDNLFVLEITERIERLQ